MKLNAPENEAYAATIVKLQNTFPVNGLDNLVGARVYGYNLLVSKNTNLDDLHLFVPAETQLSEEFARENNLHRHGNLNKDESQTGYLEDNRRIRAVKFKGNPSNGMLLPLDSLAYTGVDVSEFNDGDTFDTLNGQEICKKYVVKSTAREIKTQAPKFSRVDKRLLPEHVKTLQFWRHERQFDHKHVVVTQKLHGTSVRIANIPVANKLTWKDKIAQKFGVKVDTHEYDYVYGSRRVIKDVHNPEQDSFYSSDIHTEVGERVKDAVPKNYILYGEIIGWVDQQKPIQPHYTYNLKQGQNELYIYRIATVNTDGFVTDLSWDAMNTFCEERGLNIVPLLWRGWMKDLNVDDFMNKRYYDEGARNAIPLSHAKTKDEGVCIRYEDQIPVISKAKCSEFLELETRVLDKGEVDVEES